MTGLDYHTNAGLGLHSPGQGRCEHRGCSLVAGKASGREVQDVKPLCDPSSGFARIESPSVSGKLTLPCGAKYRLAGTHLLGCSGEKTQKGHLPFSNQPGILTCALVGFSVQILQLRTEATFT